MLKVQNLNLELKVQVPVFPILGFGPKFWIGASAVRALHSGGGLEVTLVLWFPQPQTPELSIILIFSF